MTPSEEKPKAKKEAAAPGLDPNKGFSAAAWGLLLAGIALGILVYVQSGRLVGEAGSSFLNQANFWVAFLFYQILFTVAWEAWPVAKLRKEIKAIALFAMSAVAAQLTQYILVEGHPSSIDPTTFNYYWLMADLILILLISLLAFEAWPVGDQPQPIKGAVISAEMLVAAILIYYISDNDKDLFGSTGDWLPGLWIPTLFIMIPWLLWHGYLAEGWPFGALVQPMKGFAIALSTAVLTFITYYLAATIPEEAHHIAGPEGGRAFDYVTFTAVWTAVIVIMVFAFQAWPLVEGKLAVQPMKGIVFLFLTGIIAAIVLYVWAHMVGGVDGLVPVGGGVETEEYVVPAVWFYVYVPSWVLAVTVWWDYHA
ncbi:MAG: hypothetical protein ACFE68_06430 [Candidatus Hodarchaeota archaeon]